MDKDELFEKIINAIVEIEEEEIVELTKKIIDEKIDVLEAIEKAYAVGVRKLGELFDAGEYYLPELMMGSQFAQDAIADLLPHLPSGSERKSKGKVIMATIEGDIHSIGKSIVATMLSAYGYDVVDLGADVPVEKIIEEAEKNNADIIGVSALLTTTMIGQQKVVEKLKESGLRNKYKVIIGGAPVNEDWVKKCEADGYAPSATEAVNLADNLLK